jgi:adenylyltransferase/sulfurtransferase
VSLSEAEIARYARQLLLPGFGAATQEVLRAARVHVVGAGDVAGPALLYLASAGIGTIYLDDPLDVGASDAGSWIYPADQVGEPRLLAAVGALRAASSFSKPRAFATGADPTATLVCSSSVGEAREAAEKARSAGLPHVVALVDGDGGEVVTIPRGGPCFSCGSRPGTGAPARPGAAAAVGALAAMELVLLLAGAAHDVGGRRIEVVLGVPTARPTARVPGCPCTQGWGR